MVRDERKTRAELLKELNTLRSRVAQLEQAEQSVTGSEQTFRTIFENAADGMLLADVQSKKFYMGNKAICQMLGYNRQELKNLGVMDIHPEQDMPYVIDQFEKQASGESTLAKDIPVKRKDGSVFGADISSFPVTLDGKTYLVGSFRDIAERNEADQALQESEERLRLFMDSATEGFTLWDSEFNLVRANRAVLDMFPPGTKEENLIGKNALEIVPNLRQSGRYEKYVEVMKTGKPLFFDDLVPHPKFGDRFIDVKAFRVGDGLGLIITDITERRKAEQALRQSEERYRSVVEDSPGMLCSFLPDGGIAFVNAAYCEYFGKPSEELIGTKFTSLIPEEDRQAVLDNILSLTVDSPSMTHEHKVTAPDGRICWQRWTNRALFDERDRAVLFQSLGEDITERKRAEETIRESQTLIQGILGNTGSIIVVRDIQGRYVLVNREVENVLGMETGEIIGKTPHDIYSSHHASKILTDDRRVIESRRPLDTEDQLDVEGETRTFLCSKFPLLNVAGEPYAVCTVATDITERKKAEDALKESEANLALAQQIADIGSWEWTIETDKAGWSDETYRIFGFEPNEFEPKYEDFLDRVHPDDRETVTKTTEKAMTQRDPVDYEYRVLRADGTEKTVLSRGQVFYDEGDNPVRFLGTIQDITKRKQAEDALRESEERLRVALSAARMGTWRWDPAINQDTRDASLNLILGLEAVESTQPVEDFLHFVHPEDRDMTEEVIQRSIRERRTYVAEFRIIRADGTVRWLRDQGEPLCDENNRVLCLTGAVIDITERKRVEDALRRASVAVGTSLNAVFSADLEGKVIYANPAAASMWGFEDPAAMVGTDVLDYWAEEHRQEAMRAVETSMEEGSYLNLEGLVARRKNGTAFLTEVKSSVVKDESGNPVGMVGSFIDITERRKAEEALREREQRLEYLVSSSPAVIYTSKTSGDYSATYISENVVSQTGYEAKDFIENSNFWIDHVHPGDRKRILDGLTTIFEKEYYSHEYRFLHSDGSYRWMHDDMILLRDEQGNPREIIGSWTDITHRKNVETELAASEQRYRTLVESAGDSIATIDENGVLLFVNKWAAQDLGGKPEDFVGKTMWDLFPQEIADRQAANVRKVIDTKQGMNLIVPTEVQGQPRWHSATIEPLRDSSGTAAAMVIARDISEFKKAEEELERYRDEMARAEHLASLGTLSATVAHELTQPLTVIRLSLDNALDELEATSPPETVTKRLKDSVVEVSNLTSIVERFRNFARQASRKTVGEVDLKAVAERIVQFLSESARRARIALRLKDMDRLPLVYANERDVEQLFFALIGNAVQAADGRKARELVISGAVEDEHIELRFSDDCGGIAPENLGEIFKPFFTTKPPGQGTGLGLCIVEDIASRAEGKVRVESELGKGSTFFVTLPVNEDSMS
ncbi:MAG: PAS domain S-box protein [Planctomycetota bacterium]|jgi:PAS domain S-box-containing protein